MLDDVERGSIGRQVAQWLVIFAIVSVPIFALKWWNVRQDAAIARLVAELPVAVSPQPVAVPTLDRAAAAAVDGRATNIPDEGIPGSDATRAGSDAAPAEAPTPARAVGLPSDVPVVRAPAQVPYPDRIRDVAPVVAGEAAARRGIAVLSLLIDPEGNVVEVELLRSIDEILDAAAVSAARQWKFAPTLRNGRPVAVRSNFTVPFGY